MLPEYDAAAIAEVLGLTFRRGPREGISAAPRFKVQSPLPHADEIINVDDAVLLVIEKPTNGTHYPLKTTETGDGKRLDAESRLSPSSVLIEKAVERGLPRTSLRHVAEWLAGDEKAKVAAFEWGVVPRSTLERRDTKLSPQESERTERIARLFVHARRALGTVEEAREFMTTPHPELDRRTPIDAAKTDLGTRRTEQLLTALEYGLAI